MIFKVLSELMSNETVYRAEILSFCGKILKNMRFFYLHIG